MILIFQRKKAYQKNGCVEKIDSLIPLIQEKWPNIAQQTLETAKGSIDDLVGVIASHTGLSTSGIKNQLFKSLIQFKK